MNTRLKQFLAAENITQAQFADSINVVRASVSHILSGRNNPSFDFIKAMMTRYPSLNIEWIMFGKGKMYKDTPAPEPEQLFPEEAAAPEQEITAEPPVRIQDSAHEPETHESTPPPIELKTSVNTAQLSVKQRKAIRIIVMYDDGSYQEL